MANIFHSLIGTEEAKRLASGAISIDPGTEEVKLDESVGRVLSSDIVSPMNSPPFNRSIKDGYAVRAEDVENASETSPAVLHVRGRIDIGKSPPGSVEIGTCLYIPTGGVLPEGADSVVMVEYTREEDGKVSISRAVTRGENIALAGSDIQNGELIIRKGTRIGPRELAVLSSLGISTLEVLGKIRIGIVSTGDELTEPGKELQKGRIFDSNGRTIKSLVEQDGKSFDVRLYGTLPDLEETMREKLGQYSSENDILIVSGSTSAGEKDMVYKILGEYTPGIVFHGIRIKPGKPTLLSMKGKKVVIGLPGFPVSAMMTFLTIFFPYILREAGLTAEEHYVDGILAGKVNLDTGKLNLIPVSIAGKDRPFVFPIHGGSGSISRLLRADGYISLDGNSRTAEEGQNVSVRLFSSLSTDYSRVFVGEDDPVLGRLSRKGSLKVIRAGHYSSANALAKGYADAVGLVSHSSSLDPGDIFQSESQLEFVSIWSRKEEIGIAFPQGDLKIADLNSLMETDGLFAIPGKGEGVSAVLNKILSASNRNLEEFHSRASEIGNFNSVAHSVSEGYQRAGITSESIAAKYGLDFTPIGSYYYHILCLKSRSGELRFIAEDL